MNRGKLRHLKLRYPYSRYFGPDAHSQELRTRIMENIEMKEYDARSYYFTSNKIDISKRYFIPFGKSPGPGFLTDSFIYDLIRRYIQRQEG